MKQKIKGYFKKLLKILQKPELAILPGNIAFYIILALIPLLTIVVLMGSYFNISIDSVTNMIKNIMPEQVSNTIIDAISGKGFDRNIGIFNIVAIVLASNGTYAIVNAANAIYHVKTSDVIKNRVNSFIILFIIIIMFVFLIIAPIFGENILNLLTEAEILKNYSNEIITSFNLIKWPLTLFILYFNIKLIYTISPSTIIESKDTTKGAIFTTIMWIIATIIFKFYLTYFARYDIIYGSLSTLIILMVWLYFLSYIFVLGMAINVSEKEEAELIAKQQQMEEKLKLKKQKKKNTKLKTNEK